MIGSIDFENSNERLYNVKDHLGSTRLVYGSGGAVREQMNYMPYGEFMTHSATTVGKFKFTGKERDTETNYDYFGARYYNSKLGLWNSVDPLASKYPGWSPYNYVECNPLNKYDPDGKGPLDAVNIAIYFAMWLGGKIAGIKESIQENKSKTVGVKINGETQQFSGAELLTNADIKWSKGLENSLGKTEQYAGEVSTYSSVAAPIAGSFNLGAGGLMLKVSMFSGATSTAAGAGKNYMQGNTKKLAMKLGIGAASLFRWTIFEYLYERIRSKER